MTDAAIISVSMLLLASAVTTVILRWHRQPSRYASIPATLHDRFAVAVGATVFAVILVSSSADGSVVMAVIPAALFSFIVASIVHAVRASRAR